MICGCMGCTDAPDYVIRHPKHGQLVVCETHAEPYEVVEAVGVDDHDAGVDDSEVSADV